MAPRTCSSSSRAEDVGEARLGVSAAPADQQPFVPCSPELALEVPQGLDAGAEDERLLAVALGSVEGVLQHVAQLGVRLTVVADLPEDVAQEAPVAWLGEVEAFWGDQLGAFKKHVERRAKRP